MCTHTNMQKLKVFNIVLKLKSALFLKIFNDHFHFIISPISVGRTSKKHESKISIKMLHIRIRLSVNIFYDHKCFQKALKEPEYFSQ